MEIGRIVRGRNERMCMEWKRMEKTERRKK